VLRKANLVPSGWPQLIIALARGVPRIHRVLREVAPNVVYVNTVTIPFWVMMARLRAIPVVVHVHEAEVSVHPIVRAGLSAPNLLATSIIYNSEVSKLVGHTGMVRGRPHQVIHNGVAGPPTRVEPRARLHERVELLYVGRLSPRKGVDVAVRALALLRERGVAARLTVVGAVFPGSEWYEEQMQALVAELGLSQHMRSVGFQSDVWPWLAASDIVLVPSRSEESFGNAVIEAALAGRPSVVSDHSGLREARAGLSAVRAVPAEQPGAIADAVVGLVQDWPGSRADAMRDAVLADAAYAPESYRRAVADVLARATRPTRRRWPGRLASWGRR
jgi:glycosyltransferase involved in cell wall biosynthesis